MLINLLAANINLTNFFCASCDVGDFSVHFQDAINKNDLLILRVDHFYQHLQSLEMLPNFLIVLRCSPKRFHIFLIEIRDNKSRNFDIKSIVKKFVTCLDDFMSQRFKSCFLNEEFNIQSIKLYYVSNPFDSPEHSRQDVFAASYKLDAFISHQIPRFFRRHLYIEYKVRNPIIEDCKNQE